jgi:hypothetical protein
MEIVLTVISLVLIIAALSFFASLNRKKKAKPQPKTKVALVNCPLCGSPLPKGENLVSKVYRPMNVPDQRCTISGCPHCYPVCEIGVKRVCPVCQKKVPQSGYLIARLFNKTEGKKHVLITGCTECCKHNLS